MTARLMQSAILFASMLASMTVMAQRPDPVRIAVPAQAVQPMSPPVTQNLVTAADPMELLKQVNLLRQQVSQLQKALDQQKMQASAADSRISAAEAQIALTQKQNESLDAAIKAAKAHAQKSDAEKAVMKEHIAANREIFNDHSHYQRLAHIVNGKQSIDWIRTREPYCVKNGDDIACPPPPEQ